MNGEIDQLKCLLKRGRGPNMASYNWTGHLLLNHILVELQFIIVPILVWFSIIPSVPKNPVWHSDDKAIVEMQQLTHVFFLRDFKETFNSIRFKTHFRESISSQSIFSFLQSLILSSHKRNESDSISTNDTFSSETTDQNHRPMKWLIKTSSCCKLHPSISNRI